MRKLGETRYENSRGEMIWPVRSCFRAAALAGTLVLLAPAPVLAASGYLLTQRRHEMAFEIAISDEGVKVLGSSAPDATSSPMSLGAAMRYDRGQVLLLDPEAQTYSVLPLEQALADRAFDAELAAEVVRPGSEGVGTPPEPQEPEGVYLSRLPKQIRIAGLHAEGYRLQQGQVVYRLWIARDLPVLPLPLANALRDVWANAAPDSVNRVVMDNPDVLRRLLLRAEVRRPMSSKGEICHKGNTITVAAAAVEAHLAHGDSLGACNLDDDSDDWVAVVDTVGSARVELSPDAFDAPAGWQEVAPPSRVEPESAVTSRQMISPQIVPAGPRPGPGPIMLRPEIFLVYWGSVFEQNPDFVFAMNAAVGKLFDAAYSGPLSSYGFGIDVPAGRGLLGHNISTRPLPRLVGQGDFISVGHELWVNPDTPKVWWRVGGHDPLVGFFVSSQDVDAGGWGGYHFNSFSPAIFFPFPINLFASELMPWFIIRVPQQALAAPRVIPASTRQPCHSGTTIPLACLPIVAFDDATTSLSHEFVETVTDPYPFSGISDISMQPAWFYSEVADICSEGNHQPWGKSAVVPGVFSDTVLATYWVNSPSPACVPESRPSLRLITPCDELLETCDPVNRAWQPTLALRADAYDPFVGDLDGNNVQWNIDGMRVATGRLAVIDSPSSGEHVVEATALSRNLSRSKSFRLNLVVSPPGDPRPCGDTAPACNGTCGPTEVCADTGGTCSCYVVP